MGEGVPQPDRKLTIRLPLPKGTLIVHEFPDRGYLSTTIKEESIFFVSIEDLLYHVSKQQIDGPLEASKERKALADRYRELREEALKQKMKQVR